jgi:RND family efflux transporter MFP subunit
MEPYMRCSQAFAFLHLVVISYFAVTSAEVFAVGGGQSESTLTRITTVSVQSIAFYPLRNAPAQTQSLNHSKIPARVGALLNKILVRVGDKVTKGQPLAALDCTDVSLNVVAQQAQHQQLKANYQFAQRQLRRGNNLAKRKTIGEVELDQINTNLLSLRAQLLAQKSALDNALLNQQRCTVIAPFSGMVTKRLANEGEMVERGNPVIELVQLDNVEVAANIALGDSESYSQANAYYFESAGRQYPLANRILLPMVLDRTRSQEARLNFTEQPAIPGLTGRLFWLSPTPHLPAHLLQLRQGKYGVFAVVGNLVEFIVIAKAQEGRPIPITDDEQWLQRQLVEAGRHGLIDGQQVIVTDNGDGGANPINATMMASKTGVTD